MALTKPAGTWTYDDLSSLPDDGRRYEIIEGELYEMPAPTWEHSTTIMNLIAMLLPVVSAMGGLLRTAPLDVFLPGADPVEPDILAILPGSNARGEGRGVEGSPDLVIEVLSPSNRTHDLLTKRALYARAGVREYWIVDPANRAVEVMTLDRDAFHTMQMASGADAAISPLLDGAAFQLETIFANVGEGEAEN
jgi:Uma2 family endonuclease